MLFKNPNFLYFLLLLIIPILIHLFQLQRFQKVSFTNVKFLKEIELQTRKSSKLKKLLILISRLLLFTFLIIAYAQPYFNKKNFDNDKETLIYLDNSFSMQAKGEYGELFQKAKNDLIEAYQDSKNKITLITNNKIIENLTANTLKDELLKIDYYPIKKDIETVLLQIEILKNKRMNTRINSILISDFQNINSSYNNLKLDSSIVYSFVQTQASNIENISIDSIWINDENSDDFEIRSLIKSHQMKVNNLSVSLFIDNKLYGKSTVSLDKNKSEEIEFVIPKSKSIQGKISLNDNKLVFDNNMYFSHPKNEKINILAIGNKNEFLSKIYTNDEFDYTSSFLNMLDYSSISNQQLIILNELENFPKSLIQALKYFVENEGNLVLIPSPESNISSYNDLFSTIGIGKINEILDDKKSITTINYDHPFFKNVFKKQIINFQYPNVNSYFSTNLLSSTSILQFEDQNDFISEINFKNYKIYWIASPINSANSNFSSSPLIVPVFYNFSLQNSNPKSLYFTIGAKNKIFIKHKTKNDEVIHLTNNEFDFIPLQSRSTNYIKINTEENPLKNGLYELVNKSEIFQSIAYNYNREESKLTHYPIKQMKNSFNNVQFFTSLNKAIEKINDENKNKNLWQLFIIFALIFLGIEIILQKFLKN